MIVPCVSKPNCTHGIIVSLWLICCVQCGFSISYQSIPGIIAHDNAIFFEVLLFFVQFNFQCHAVPFIYITVFQEASKRCSVVGRWVGSGVGSYLFILRFWPVSFQSLSLGFFSPCS